MRISRIHIKNFRNFRVLNLDLAGNAVIVGENKIGKTNLLYALRLVLDPTLPDSTRQLQNDDFCEGLARPLTRADKITIAVDLTDFEGNEDHVALLAEHLVEPEPMTARLTYVFQPLETLASWIARATRTTTPPRFLAIGKENAARHCAQALSDAVNLKPQSKTQY